ACRDERSRLRDLIDLQQADPWRAALPGAWRLWSRARGVERARGVAADGAAFGPANALHATASAGSALGAAAALRAFSVRRAWRAQTAARVPHGRSDAS